MQDLSDAVPFIVERRVDAGEGLEHQGKADLEPMTDKQPTASEVGGPVVRQQDREEQQV